MFFVFYLEQLRGGCQVTCVATSCLPTNDESIPWSSPGRHATPPPFFLSSPGSLPLPLFPVFLPVTEPAPRPSPLTAVSRHPDLLRAHPQLRLATLVLLAAGIGPWSPETPPPSPILPADLQAAAAEFAAIGAPPAEPSSPECSW
jgi:hypothetical protein